MTKKLFCMLILLSTQNLFAQIEKGNIFISGFGNYIKTSTENGVTTNYNTSNIKSLNTGVSIGYLLTDRFIAGVGFEFIHEKEVRYNSLDLTSFVQEGEMLIKSKGFLPNAYIGYYIPIIPKLYLNANLKLSFGQVKSDFEELLIGTKVTESSDPALGGHILNIKSWSRNNKTDYFESQITPEISYLFSKKFSAYLGLGGISYSMLDWKTDNSSLLITFNPNYWIMGMKFHL